MRAVGVSTPVRLVGVDGVGDSPRRAAFRDAVSLCVDTEGEGEGGMELDCDMSMRSSDVEEPNLKRIGEMRFVYAKLSGNPPT